MPIEIIRRLVLVIGLAAAAWLSRQTPREAFIALSRLDCSRPAVEAPRSSRSLLPARVHRDTCEMLAEQAATGKGDLNVIPVSGPRWRDFFNTADEALDKSVVPPGWEHRVTAKELKESRKSWYGGEKPWKDFTRLYFWVNEPPFSEVAGDFSRNDSYYIKLDSNPPRYVEAWCTPLLKAATLGSGFFGVPRDFAYPRFRLALWLALATLLIYALLPWPKIAANVSALARWRVVLGDLA